MLKERAPYLLNAVSESLEFLKGRPVAIDIDAVTQATYILALKQASQTLGKVILREELITYWELANIAKKLGVSEDKAMDFARDAWNRDDIYLNAPEMPGVRTLLQVLDELRIPYLFSSARPKEFEAVTREWFNNTFPWVPQENIIVGREHGVPGGLFKSQVSRRFNAGVQIEDAIEDAVIIADTIHIPILIVPQPWNVRENITHKEIKLLEDYSESAGTWPVLRFLVGREAKAFFASVAQS